MNQISYDMQQKASDRKMNAWNLGLCETNSLRGLQGMVGDWYVVLYRGGSRQASTVFRKTDRNEEKNKFFINYLPSEDKTTKKIQKINI